MRNLILIAFCFVGLFLSCGKTIDKSDLEGTWYCENCEESYIFSFKQDTIYWSGKYDFVRSGAYEIIDDNLQIITSNNDTILFPIAYFQTAIDSFSSDSLVLDTMIFRGKSNEQLYERKFSLVDIETEPFIIDKERNERFEYRQLSCLMENDSFIMKVNQNYISHEDLNIYLSPTLALNVRESVPLLFLGKRLTLKHFSDLQYWLSLERINRIVFITQSSGFDEFHGFEMKLPLFPEMNVDNKWKPKRSQPLPPPPLPFNKKEYLEHFKNAQKIMIDSSIDLIKLNNIKKGDLVHIIFNGNLDMKTYIQAQMILKPLIKARNIRTEILDDTRF